MRSRGTARVLPWLLSAGLILAGAASQALARGEWYDDYESALAALDGADPHRAIELLESALAKKERSGYLRTYGNNYIRYVPRYYLGVAFHDAGDCRSALESFDLSDGADETRGAPALAARLRSLRAACEVRLAQAERDSEPAVLPADVEPSPAENIEALPEAPASARTPPADPVGEILESGLRSYLRGDLDSAIRSFERLTRESPRSAYFRLLLGTALYGSWTMGGESDEELVSRARRVLAEAARLDPDLVPDPRLCPPRVARLYRSLR